MAWYVRKRHQSTKRVVGGRLEQDLFDVAAADAGPQNPQPDPFRAGRHRFGELAECEQRKWSERPIWANSGGDASQRQAVRGRVEYQRAHEANVSGAGDTLPTAVLPLRYLSEHNSRVRLGSDLVTSAEIGLE
jgi:hypothetical protein